MLIPAGWAPCDPSEHSLALWLSAEVGQVWSVPVPAPCSRAWSVPLSPSVYQCSEPASSER